MGVLLKGDGRFEILQKSVCNDRASFYDIENI